MRKLRGLEKLCKLYGRIDIGGVLWVWDYHRNVAVPDYKLKSGSRAWKLSEKARFEAMRKAT